MNVCVQFFFLLCLQVSFFFISSLQFFWKKRKKSTGSETFTCVFVRRRCGARGADCSYYRQRHAGRSVWRPQCPVPVPHREQRRTGESIIWHLRDNAVINYSCAERWCSGWDPHFWKRRCPYWPGIRSHGGVLSSISHALSPNCLNIEKKEKESGVDCPLSYEKTNK